MGCSTCIYRLVGGRLIRAADLRVVGVMVRVWLSHEEGVSLIAAAPVNEEQGGLGDLGMGSGIICRKGEIDGGKRLGLREAQ